MLQAHLYRMQAMPDFKRIGALLLLASLLLLAMASCGTCCTNGKICTWDSEKGNTMKIEKAKFGTAACGTDVDLYTLTNDNGIKASIINLGGTIVSLEVPDKNGNMADVVLGRDSVESYEKGQGYFGALIGRFGNRIANGKFTLDGKEYSLATNNDKNHLHGGLAGFDKAVWSAEEIRTDNAVGLKLCYTSKDGEESYPGNLDITVTYLLTNDNALSIDYKATTDQATPVNLTNHSYFNLKGHGEGDILGHMVMLNADNFTPVTENLVPTGEIKAVAGTPFDFTSPKKISDALVENNTQLLYGLGIDHNFVLNSQDGSMALAARVTEPSTGRVMEVYTTQPGVQFYIGNFLNGQDICKGGKKYNYRAGLCLETQHYPDSPNHPDFPTVILQPGKTYSQTTEYRFSAE